MAKWLISWVNNGKFNNQEILPDSYISEAISSHAVVGSDLPSKEMPNSFMSNYGYGWFISSYKGQYSVEHGGNIDGFSANVAFFPADDIGIVVLTNQNSSALPTLVTNTVADATEWNHRLGSILPEKKQNLKR